MATLQPPFSVSGALSLLFRELSADISAFVITLAIFWPLCLATLAVDIFLDTRISRRVPIVQTRKLAVILVTIGAAVALIRGISATSSA